MTGARVAGAVGLVGTAVGLGVDLAGENKAERRHIEEYSKA